MKANYLASPPLVVAYALAGTSTSICCTSRSAHDTDGKPVYLRTSGRREPEIQRCLEHALGPDMFREQYDNVYDGDERWNEIPVAERRPVRLGRRLAPTSRSPPYFDG